MTRAAPLTIGLSTLMGCALPAWPPAGKCRHPTEARTYEVEIPQHGGRTAELHVPPGSPEEAVPLVIDLHFLGGSAFLENHVTGLRSLGDERGVAVLQPNGVDGAYNAGKCCGEPWRNNVDDVAFVEALLDEISSAACIDASRVYATGLSNGGMMAHRLGCELSERILAIAPVAAPLHVASCRPQQPVSVLYVHGTEDPVIPFAGGQGEPPIPIAGDLSFASSDETLAEWKRINQCEDAPSSQTAHGEKVTCTTYPCIGGVEVERCVVRGGGHTWPGGEPTTLIPGVLGTINDDLQASRYMLDFFLRQGHRGPLGRGRD
jgi:polyhydroxybutyrate depolymerase